MAQDQTDLFSQGSKQLPSDERKVHSLELSNLTAYVSIKLIEDFHIYSEELIFLLFFVLDCMNTAKTCIE